MIRVLLLFIVAIGLPFGLFILWRSYLPTSLGGSEAIEKEEWEPLPWPWLGIASAISLVAAFTLMILFPEWFGAS